MKNKIRILLSVLSIICFAFYACNSDNDYPIKEHQESQTSNFNNLESRKGGGINQIDYHPEQLCHFSGPSCVLPGGTTTFTMTCGEGNGTGVTWQWQQGVGITPVGELQQNGSGGYSQAFTFSSNFQQGWIFGICNGAICKDQITVLPCSSPPPPNCSITGPNCGTEGDILTYTYNGASNVNWTSLSSGITLVSSNGNTATFSLNSNFGQSGGSIRGSALGCDIITFDINNCCVQSIITIDYDRHTYKN